ncbi:OmpA family protein [Spirosoma panaciterrae]|uniref:OmpA family protein n=1 Tax=Spirosoma panaciterrae TaxID=496058 RepID=UPI0003666842|nr:OmpA family protein [Spirosoma panaciterrae]
MGLHIIKLLLASGIYLLAVGMCMAQRQAIDYSRIKASPKASPVMAGSVVAGRSTTPSLLTIKAFAVDISKPIPAASVKITSRTTGKTQQVRLTNGRLERVINEPDVLAIEVSEEGYTTRTITIAVSPTGKPYEFDAQLDPAPVKLTVWAMDSQTRKIITDAHFTISGRVGEATLLLSPDTATGLIKIDLPRKGVYQLTSSAVGYGDFTKSIRLDSVENEARVMLTPQKTKVATEAQALPEAIVKSTKTVREETPAAPIPIKAPALSSALRVPTIPIAPPKSLGVLEKGKPVQLANIYFDQSSPVLRSESYPELDQLATLLINNPSTQVEIRGHTDNQGDFDLNVKLSRDRCQAVIDYLAGKGIARNRLKAVGRGPIDPVAPNTSEANRLKNRRVEFVVL